MAIEQARRPVKLVLSDVDGTLVTKQKVILDSTKEAVRRLADAGIMFAITSSRPPQGLMHLVEPLNITTPIAGFNGGLITDTKNNELHKTPLHSDSAEHAIDVLIEREVDIWVFHGNDWLVTNPEGDYVAHEQHTIQYGPKVVEHFGPYVGGVTKIVGSSTKADHLKETEEIMRAKLGTRASVSLSQAYYLDVTHEEANKGTAVMALSEMYKIDPSEIVSIGDMENDVRMFEKAGFSIAMGNANASVKARAKAVTGTNEEGGWGQAMEKYVLPYAPK